VGYDILTTTVEVENMNEVVVLERFAKGGVVVSDEKVLVINTAHCWLPSEPM